MIAPALKGKPTALDDRYGRWAVLRGTEHRIGKAWYVVCRCDCGTERPVTTYSLRIGKSRCCGCDRGCVSKHPLYVRYRSMLDRCHCRGNKGYARYGARGIYVCERWRDSFAAFVADVGLPPEPDMQLDRIDNDGPYAPGNVRWADRVTQARNTRRNRMVEFSGETLCIGEWATRLGLAWTTIDNRLKAGWTVEEALTLPRRRGSPTKPRGPRHEWRGECLTLQEISDRTGIAKYTLLHRLRTGVSIEEATSMPSAPKRKPAEAGSLF